MTRVGKDIASMSPNTHVVSHHGPEEIRQAQLTVAAACKYLWPDQPVETTREMLQILGLYRRTGLETF